MAVVELLTSNCADRMLDVRDLSLDDLDDPMAVYKFVTEFIIRDWSR